MMVESPVDPVGPLTSHIVESDLTPIPRTPVISPHSPPNLGNCPLPTPPWLSPVPYPPLRPPSNMSAHKFVEDFCFVLSHEPVDPIGSNHLTIPDNIRALWTQTERAQQAIEDRDHQIHNLSIQLNGVLQALADLQSSHQNLQDTVWRDTQEIDEGFNALHSQLDSLHKRAPIWLSPIPSLATTPNPESRSPEAHHSTPTPQATVTSTEPNLKPAKPEAWDGTECDAKPFRNRVLNYLGSFAGAVFSKQVVFVLSLTTHAKSQSWTNTCQDWLANTPAHLPQSIAMLLDDFVLEFGDKNATISAQHWIDTTFQG